MPRHLQEIERDIESAQQQVRALEVELSRTLNSADPARLKEIRAELLLLRRDLEYLAAEHRTVFATTAQAKARPPAARK